jgi:hypothetical protein
MDFQTRDRVASEYFAKEYSAPIRNHSAGSMKFTFGQQLDGWIYWSEKGLLSISKVKGTGQNWVQPYDFNKENPPRIRNFLIGCAVDFGIDLSVSVPKNKAKDLVMAYEIGIRLGSKQVAKRKKSAATRKKKVKKKVNNSKIVKKKIAKTKKKPTKKK